VKEGKNSRNIFRKLAGLSSGLDQISRRNQGFSVWQGAWRGNCSRRGYGSQPSESAKHSASGFPIEAGRSSPFRSASLFSFSKTDRNSLPVDFTGGATSSGKAEFWVEYAGRESSRPGLSFDYQRFPPRRSPPPPPPPRRPPPPPPPPKPDSRGLASLTRILRPFSSVSLNI